MTASTPEQEGGIRVPVPTYDLSRQISIELNAEQGRYGDPILHAVSLERTRVLREIQRTSGIPASTTGGLGLRWALEHIDPSVGRNFDSHGIAKAQIQVWHIQHYHLKTDRFILHKD